MGARNASVLAGDQPTRYSYALVANPSGGSGTSGMTPGRNGGATRTHLRQKQLSFDSTAAGQPVGGSGGRKKLMKSRRRGSGTPGVAEFQYRYSNGRLDNG